MQHESLSAGQDALKLKSRGGVLRVVKAAGYSLAGLRAAFVYEAAFRQLLLLATALIPLAFSTTREGTPRAVPASRSTASVSIPLPA